MTTKQYLYQIENLDKYVKNKLLEKCQLRSLSVSIRSTMPNGDRVQQSPRKDPMGDIIAKLDELDREIEKTVSNYLEIRKEIISTIEKVENTLYYDILYKKYVEYKNLIEIADEIGYSVQHVRFCHTKALEEVRKIKNFKS